MIDLSPDIYLSNNYIVLDFETTNLDKGSSYNPDNKLVYSSWTNGNEYKRIYGNEFSITELLEDIDKADFIVAQNAKFELGWLARCGLDISRVVVYDTMIGEYVINGNRKTSLNLDYLCTKYKLKTKNNLIKILMESGICPSEMPESVLCRYGDMDVHNTHQIFLKQREKLNELSLLPVMFTRCLLTPVLADIEKNGMFLDRERVEIIYGRKFRELQEVNTQINQATNGINPNSGKQVAEFLYDVLGFDELKDRAGNPIRGAGGGRKTDSDTISALTPRNKRQREFLALKKKQSELNAEVTKALEKFYACTQAGGILYANFNQTITQTHRLSSNGKPPYAIQFQNFPRKFKPLFKARNKGWKIGEADGAQLEFRVAAHCGQDGAAREAIENKFDVHTFTAKTLTEAGQPTDRQGAKAHTFKPLYGGQSGTRAEQTYYRAFRERYPGIARTQQEWITNVLTTKQLRIASGLIFYWPDTQMIASGYITNTPSICNYPVQSFATADIIPIAVRYLWQRMREANMQSFLINTIHDSAIAEIHPEEEKLFEELAELSFTKDVYNYLKVVYGIDFSVPLEADVKITDNWSDSEKWRQEWINPNLHQVEKIMKN